MSLEQWKEELPQSEYKGEVSKVRIILQMINEALKEFVRNPELLNALANLASATAMTLSRPFLYYLPDENVNNQTRCNGRMQENIQQQIQNKNINFFKEVFPAIATNQDVSSKAYSLISNQSTINEQARMASKVLFRQGIMVKVTTPNGNPVMIYIGGISPYWNAGKVTACQYGAIRQFNYNKKVKDSLSKLMFGGEMMQIGLLVSRERPENIWINPVNPSYTNSNPYTTVLLSFRPEIERDLESIRVIVTQASSYHYRCSLCSNVASFASGVISTIDFLPAFNAQIYFGIPQIGTYVGIGTPADPFDEFYNGSPLYVAGSDCQSPTIAGFIKGLANMKDVLQNLASQNNVNFNEVLSKVDQNAIESSGFLIRIPPPSSWTYDAIAEWAMKYLSYSPSFLNSMINFAVVLGELLAKYPEDVAEQIEDKIYEEGPSYACGDYNECYQELSKLVEDIYQALESGDSNRIDVIKLCRDRATTVDNSCVQKCIEKAESEMKDLSSFAREHLGLSGESWREVIGIQCQEVCTKFNPNEYIQCVKTMSHISP